MSDKTEYNAAFDHGRQAQFVTQLVEGVTHILVPGDCNLQSMEKLLPAPRRIVANPEFYDVDGFADYAKEFKSDGTRIFVDQEQRRFFTIFDFHAPGQPAWGDHSASLAVKLSPEWERWKKIDGKQLEPQELAEWLEDNLEYVMGPVGGSELLDMAQNLKVTLKGNLQIDQTLQAGLRTLQIKDESTLAGKSGGKDLSFPERVDLALRIYDHGDTYPIKVYLRYRTATDSVVFFFKIPDPERLEEQAFDLIVSKVREATELKTLKGKFSGPRHK